MPFLGPILLFTWQMCPCLLGTFSSEKPSWPPYLSRCSCALNFPKAKFFIFFGTLNPICNYTRLLISCLPSPLDCRLYKKAAPMSVYFICSQTLKASPSAWHILDAQHLLNKIILRGGHFYRRRN